MSDVELILDNCVQYNGKDSTYTATAQTIVDIARQTLNEVLFYPWVTVFITVRITKAFGLPKPSLFSKYKVMLLLCCLRVN